VKQYWYPFGTDGGCYEVDGVPDDAVPFAIRAPCPYHDGKSISHIIRDNGAITFRCDGPGDEPNDHQSTPAKMITTEDDVLIVTDGATGKRQFFEGQRIK
jgi:hypothetical protein